MQTSNDKQLSGNNLNQESVKNISNKNKKYANEINILSHFSINDPAEVFAGKIGKIILAEYMSVKQKKEKFKDLLDNFLEVVDQYYDKSTSAIEYMSNSIGSSIGGASFLLPYLAFLAIIATVVIAAVGAIALPVAIAVVGIALAAFACISVAYSAIIGYKDRNEDKKELTQELNNLKKESQEDGFYNHASYSSKLTIFGSRVKFKFEASPEKTSSEENDEAFSPANTSSLNNN